MARRNLFQRLGERGMEADYHLQENPPGPLGVLRTGLHRTAATAVDVGWTSVSNPFTRGMVGLAAGALRGMMLGIAIVSVLVLCKVAISGMVAAGIVVALGAGWSIVKGLKDYNNACLTEPKGAAIADSIVKAAVPEMGSVPLSKIKAAQAQRAQEQGVPPLPPPYNPPERVAYGPQSAAVLAREGATGQQKGLG